MEDDNNFMKIGELADKAGVSKPTIHFYLREGLLAPPVQTSRNMALYGPQHLEEIRLIKELQETRYLPLAVIKRVLEDKRTGHDTSRPDHLGALDLIFAGTGASDQFTADELIQESGLSPLMLKELQSRGILQAASEKAGFDGIDLTIARSVSQLTQMGIQREDLVLYTDLLNLLRAEVNLVHDHILIAGNQIEHPPLDIVLRILAELKQSLGARVLSDFILQHEHNHERIDG
ncbi:MAG: MerR family transcriptional regulator [Methylocystaceae bacterium]